MNLLSPTTLIKTCCSSAHILKTTPSSFLRKKTPPVTFNTGCWHHPAFYYSPPESKYSLIHHSRLFLPDISYTTLPLTPDPDHCCCVRPWIPEARSHGAVVKLTGKREFLCFSSSLVFHLSKPCV